MKHPTLFIGTVILATTLLSAGCDRGTPPDCGSDSLCISVGAGSGVNGGGSGNGGPIKDTVTTPKPETGTPSSPAYDSGANVKKVAAAALEGIPSVPGGHARQLAFYLKDSTLHMAASSDGDAQATYNRETVFDLLVLSTDSMWFDWDAKPDANLLFGGTVGIDLVSGLPLAIVKLPAIVLASRAHIRSRRGATLTIWVKAHSGNADKLSESALPLVGIDSTRAMLVSGSTLSPLPSDPFQITIP